MALRLFFKSFLVCVFTLGLAAALPPQTRAEISGPIPLGPPPQPPSTAPAPPSGYPPATQPYQPEPSPSQMGVPHVPDFSYNQPEMPAANEVPAISQHPLTSREELESAAAQCHAEIEQLWQQKSQVPRHNMPFFQKSIGEAKARCDDLKELTNSFKKADENLQSFRQNLQKAQEVTQRQ